MHAALPLLDLRGGLAAGCVASCVDRALASYGRALASAPLATNAASAASLAVFSDGVAQSATSQQWDAERSAWMAVWGSAVTGVLFFFWLQALGALFPRARTSATQLVGKVLVNQLVMSPILNGGFFAFVIWTRTPPRLSVNVAKRRLLLGKCRQDLLPTIRRACAFWSVVQTLNFRLIPVHLGVLFTNAAFVVWTAYLSFVGNRAAKEG